MSVIMLPKARHWDQAEWESVGARCSFSWYDSGGILRCIPWLNGSSLWKLQRDYDWHRDMEHFLYYWPFVRSIHWSLVDSPHVVFMISLLLAWTIYCTNCISMIWHAMTLVWHHCNDHTGVIHVFVENDLINTDCPWMFVIMLPKNNHDDLKMAQDVNLFGILVDMFEIDLMLTGWWLLLWNVWKRHFQY